MAKALQCDRCGRYFNPLQMDFTMCKFRNPVFQTRKDVNEGTIGSYLLPDESPDTWIDLCPSCAEDFEAFMGGAPLSIYDPPMCEKDADHIVTNVVNKVCPNILPEGSYVWKGPSPKVTLQECPIPRYDEVSAIDSTSAGR